MQSTSWPAYVLSAIFVAGLFAVVYLDPTGRPRPVPQPIAPVAPPIAQSYEDRIESVGAGFVGKLTFDEWQLICGDTASGGEDSLGDTPTSQRICRANHIIRTGEDKASRLAAVNIIRAAAVAVDQAVLFLRLRPEAQSGEVIFWVDENQRYSAPIARCTQQECVVQSVLPEVFIQEMREGREIQFLIPAPDSRKVLAEAPLRGFAPAYEALRRAAAVN